MAGIMVMAAMPSGRRLISQIGVEPKWLLTNNFRLGGVVTSSTRTATPVRVTSISKHDKHLGYVAVLGIAVGMVALVCFYLCVWLVRQGRRRALVPASVPASVPVSDPAPGPAPPWAPPDYRDESEEESDGGLGVVKREASGDGEVGATLTWNSERVELVLMAGEHVPTFVAHPVEQCPPIPAAQGNVPQIGSFN